MRKKTSVFTLTFSILAVALVLMLCGRARAETVQSVKVQVRFVSNTPPTVMSDKIAFSIEQVSLKALQDKSVDEAATLKTELTELMEKIFNQVLGGYLVRSVDINIASETRVDILLEPIKPFVQSLDVVLEFEGAVHPAWNELLASERDRVHDVVSSGLENIPVLSDRWSEKAIVENLPNVVDFSALFPGFAVEPELDIAEHAVLRLRLRAKGETIRDAGVKMRSNTIPALALEQLKYDAAVRADLLIGLPLNFARARQNLIHDDIIRYLQQSRAAQMLRLDIEMKLQLQPRARLVFVANSQRFNGFLRAKLSLGKEDANPDVEGHIGVVAVENIEIFTEFNVLPGPIEVDVDFGVGRRFGHFLFAGTGIEVTEGDRRIWLDAYLTEDLIISWEKGVSEDPKRDIEGSIKFRAHDFFSFDIVSDFNTDIWLRFNTNL